MWTKHLIIALVYKNALGYDKFNYCPLNNQITNKINAGKAKLTGLEHATYGTKYKSSNNKVSARK